MSQDEQLDDRSRRSKEDRNSLPHRLRLLCIGPEEPPWALLALRLESAGCLEAEFDWQSGTAPALSRLRQTTFDVVLLLDRNDEGPSRAGAGIVEAVRVSGDDTSLVVLLERPDDELLLQYDRFDCEVLVSPHGWQSRAIALAIQRALTGRQECRGIAPLERGSMSVGAGDGKEAVDQLDQLRSIISQFGDGDETPAVSIPAQIETYYREMLRTYVMMGSGSLRDELERLAELFSLSEISPQQAMAVHVTQVESLLSGLGNRSSRLVMARAHLLAVELLIHLGERYRQKSRFRGLGDAGVDLMHAESLLQRYGD